MKNNINNLIILMKKIEYFRDLRNSVECLYEDVDTYVEEFYFEDWLKEKATVEEVEGIKIIVDEATEELDFVLDNMEEKAKFVFEHIVKLNIDDILKYFKEYKSIEIIRAFTILLESYTTIDTKEQLIVILKIILEKGIF